MRKFVIFGLCLLGALGASYPGMAKAPAAEPKGNTYKVASGQGDFLIFTQSVGLLSYLGHDLTLAVKDFSGKVQFDPKNPDKASLELTIRSDSLGVIEPPLKPKDIREIHHEMNDKVLKTDRFPEIHFKSAGVQAAQGEGGKWDLRIEGDLNLCGVTRPVTIPVELKMEGGSLRAKGEFILKQKDFKIKPYSAIAGGIRVKNELTVFFNLLAK